jgi:metal-responsive CopG/Arc/MetJ family transcriptional regulator
VAAERPSRGLYRTSVMLPIEERHELQEIADRRYISLSDAIREAVIEKVQREKRTAHDR